MASAIARCRRFRAARCDACRDVFGAEIPHYFRHLFTDERSVAPRVELASGLDGPDPRCVVSIIGCTGDWFGGWDGLTAGSVDQFITADLKHGRLPEVIARGEPAVHGLPLARHVLQRAGNRLQDLPEKSSSGCTPLTTTSSG